mmetsp:Transcript_17158/g.13955  ORF Transcript_17158/g.13955 Transcript_17158/m.13955 type:complete len:115 (-) Transcript_17158:49-393(-)
MTVRRGTMVRGVIAMAMLMLACRADSRPLEKQKGVPKGLVSRLLDTHAVEGKVPGEKIDKLVKKLGAEDSFDWREFDSDSDGMIEVEEFWKMTGHIPEKFRKRLVEEPHLADEL